MPAKKVVLRNARIVTAYNDVTIGTKVTDHEPFKKLLKEAVRKHKFDDLGHGQILLPGAKDMVSCGVARLKDVPSPAGFHLRPYRGDNHLFAKRKHAITAEHVAAIVYTREAYAADPDEGGLLADCTHVLIAVLGWAGEQQTPPVTPWRFVNNLAGGNASYSPARGYTWEKCVEEAKESHDYWAQWVVVADEDKESMPAKAEDVTSLVATFVSFLGTRETQVKSDGRRLEIAIDTAQYILRNWRNL